MLIGGLLSAWYSMQGTPITDSTLAHDAGKAAVEKAAADKAAADKAAADKAAAEKAAADKAAADKAAADKAAAEKAAADKADLASARTNVPSMSKAAIFSGTHPP
jgi:membrane protein involved in colicin uptake